MADQEEFTEHILWNPDLHMYVVITSATPTAQSRNPSSSQLDGVMRLHSRWDLRETTDISNINTQETYRDDRH